MLPDRAREFGFDPTVVQLNHASFGVPTRAALDRLDATHRWLEHDPAVRLRDGLAGELAPVRALVASRLHAEAGQLALVANATEAAAALATSLPLTPGEGVVLLDAEYESVIRAWQVRAERCGASCTVLRTPVPATADGLVGTLAAASAGTRWFVVSAVTSATALRLPVPALVALARERGARVVLDAAHVVGHEPLDLATAGVGAAFGSLHKWLPVPRPVGFLWVAPDLRDVVRPAAVAVDYDEPYAVRFAWRGTWDPAPALGVPAAWDEWDAWSRAGDLERAAALADRADDELAACGWISTGAADLRPARLHAFVVPATRETLRAAADAAGIRLWAGTLPDGRTLARVATHVYSDDDDVARLVALARTLP
jgi:isopenicillin-N epimerase